MNYHWDIHFRYTFQMWSRITHISIAQPSYKQIHDSSQAKNKYDVYYDWISNGCRFSILNGYCVSDGNIFSSCQSNKYLLMLQRFITDQMRCHQ